MPGILGQAFQNMKQNPRAAMGGGGYGPLGMVMQSGMQRGQGGQGAPFMGPLSGMQRPMQPQSMPGNMPMPRAAGPGAMPGMGQVMGQPMRPQMPFPMMQRPMGGFDWRSMMQRGFPMGFGR
jgi:hypothetical protein